MHILAIGNLFNSISIQVESFCHKDSEVSIRNLYFRDTGAVGVVAAIAAHLNCNCSLLAKVSKSEQALSLLSTLEKFGIDISKIIKGNDTNNLLITIYDNNNDRHCYSYIPNEITYEDVSGLDFSLYDAVFFCCLSSELINKIFSNNSTIKKTTTVLLPSGLSNDYFVDKKLINESSYFFMNKGELERIVGFSLAKESSIINVVENLSTAQTNLIITMGKDGVLIKSREQIISSYEVEKVGKILHPGGAGDSFATGFIIAKLKGNDDYNSCKMGHMCAKLLLSSNSIIDLLSIIKK